MIRCRALAYTTATAILASAVGCDRHRRTDDEPPETSHTAAPEGTGAKPNSTGITIEMDPDTKAVRVKGGTPITGDPEKCAAYQACCKHPDASLFCGMLQAGHDKPTCSQALDKVRQYLKERGSKPPAGC